MQDRSTHPFTFVVPTLVDDFNLISINIPEDDQPIYEATTTYAVADKVFVTTGYHKVYQSLQADNIGNFPPDNPLAWVEVGPTNAWAMFDESGGTRTAGTSKIEFQIKTTLVDTLAFLGLQANTVKIEARYDLETPGTELLLDFVNQVYIEGDDRDLYYSEEFQMGDTAQVLDWFSYFYLPIKRKQELIVTDIPPVGGATITITLESDGAVGLDTFVMGRKEEYGKTQYGASAGIIDYSRKEVDQFGTAKLVRRKFSKRMDVKLWLDKAETDFLYQRLTEMRATPALWIGARDQYELLTIYGFYRDFNIDITYPSVNFCTLQIEGLS